jgi:predicted DNA-binding transcriptional regulator AlpA
MAVSTPGVTATVSLRETAQILGLNLKTVYKLIETGTFPVPVLEITPRIKRVPLAALRAYVDGEGVE